MHLTPMRFKEFVWPHNPEVYTMEFRRELAAHPVPFGRCVLQEVGLGYHVLRGEGVFVGEDAYEQFRQLAEVFQEDGPGLLIHPVWQTERAYFVELKAVEEPLPNYVRYSFEFWEDWNGYDTGLQENDDGGTAPWMGDGESAQTGYQNEQKTYTVCKGDTLWGIAKKYGIALTDLIAVNPQIKNPNLIYPGEQVNIP